MTYRKWIADSFNYYEGISRSVEGADAGVTAISGYAYSNNSPSIVRVSTLFSCLFIYKDKEILQYSILLVRTNGWKVWYRFIDKPRKVN